MRTGGGMRPLLKKEESGCQGLELWGFLKIFEKSLLKFWSVHCNKKKRHPTDPVL